jgi:Na+/H+ antiporter NhaC
MRAGRRDRTTWRDRTRVAALVVVVAAAMVLLSFPLFAGAWNGDAGRVQFVAQEEAHYLVEAPDPALRNIPMTVTVEALEPGVETGVELQVDGRTYPLDFADGVADAEGVEFGAGDQEVTVLVDGEAVPVLAEADGDPQTALSVPTIPAWLTLLPPLVAIGLALATRQVIPSLLLGVWVGAWLTTEFSLYGIWLGLLATFDNWIVRALVPADGDEGRIMILIFTIMIGGMAGIISRNGGARGIVERIIPWAKTRRKGQMSTSAVGTGLFFDDYAGMLVTGPSMRPVTDKLKVSREKLAYIVDTTAAPLATLLLVTTWVGFQVGLIGEATGGLAGFPLEGYPTFLNALPYMLYPILAFVLMWFVAATGRDFGPMRKAEERAIGGDVTSGDEEEDEGEDNELAPPQDVPVRALNALIPIGVLVTGVIVTLFLTGEGDSVMDIIGTADSYSALMYGSLLAVLVAAALTLGQRLLSLGDTVRAWVAGFKAVIEVLVILTLAWALSDITQTLNTAAFLTSLLGENLPVAFIPAIVFVLAAAVAFATGTSWGTMGILLPLTVPLAWNILGDEALVGGDVSGIVFATVAATLAGAVWGDHASPISDTTVLSAATSGCGVVEHTNTQLPYALLGGIVAALGFLAIGFGLPWWLVLPVALLAMLAVFWIISRRPEAAAEAQVQAPPGEREERQAA